MGIGKLSSRWKVNGTPIYEPSSGLQILHTSISSADSGRTEDGYMHNTWVRRDMVKISLSWRALTGNEVRNLINLMQGKNFTLTYYELGQTHTAQVYVAEVNYKDQGSTVFASQGGLCTDISANAVEM